MNKLYIILLAFGLVIGQGIAGAGLTHNGLYAQNKGKKKGGKKGGKKGKSGKKSDEPDPKKKKRIDFLFIEANTQYMRNRPKEAIHLFEQVLELDSKHHASLYNIAKLSFETGDVDKAVKFGNAALEVEEGIFWYYDLMRRVYEEKAEKEKAAREKAEMEKAAREKAEKEKAAREKEALEKAKEERLIQEKQIEEKIRLVREEAAKVQAEKVKAQQEFKKKQRERRKWKSKRLRCRKEQKRRS